MVSKACLQSSRVMDGNELVILCCTIYKASATDKLKPLLPLGSYLHRGCFSSKNRMADLAPTIHPKLLIGGFQLVDIDYKPAYNSHNRYI